MRQRGVCVLSCICIAILCILVRNAYNKRNDIRQIVHKYKLEYYSDKKADIVYLKSLDLPLVIIRTRDSNEPTFEEAISPTGWGRGIKNAEYVKMDMDIFIHDSLAYSNRSEGGAKIKIRGNTSAYNDKKSYKIKFANKVNLIHDGSYSREWILLRTYGSLKTAIGFETNRMMGMRYTPRYKYVNLVVNNNYRGLYVLTESLERNKSKVDVSEDGYIIEADAYYWNEEHFFKTNLLDEHFGYTFKYPSSKKIDDECVNYIKDYMLKFESSIPVGKYDNYIDIDSWVLWLMVHDILGSLDAGGSNIFLSKQDRSDSTKLQMPTTWDFDAIFMSDSRWASVHDNCFYYHLLFNSVNPSFKKIYFDTYKRRSSDFFHQMNVFLTSIEKSRMGVALDYSKQLDSKRWDYQYKPIKEEIADVRLWFSERRKWMDMEMNSMEKQ